MLFYSWGCLMNVAGNLEIFTRIMVEVTFACDSVYSVHSERRMEEPRKHSNQLQSSVIAMQCSMRQCNASIPSTTALASSTHSLLTITTTHKTKPSRSCWDNFVEKNDGEWQKSCLLCYCEGSTDNTAYIIFYVFLKGIRRRWRRRRELTRWRQGKTSQGRR